VNPVIDFTCFYYKAVPQKLRGSQIESGVSFCGNFFNASCTQSLGNLHGKTGLDRAKKNPKKGIEYISI
jgi:hypothetical protein